MSNEQLLECLQRPIRLQRIRVRNYVLPSRGVYVSGRGKWSDPFHNPKEFDRVLRLIVEGKTSGEIGHRSTLYLHMRNIAENIEELRGKDLVCNCKLGKSCHADSLIRLANR